MSFENLENKDLMVDGVLYNCSAHVEVNKQTNNAEVLGNPVEKGIIQFFLDKNLGGFVENAFATKE